MRSRINQSMTTDLQDVLAMYLCQLHTKLKGQNVLQSVVTNHLLGSATYHQDVFENWQMDLMITIIIIIISHD